MKILLEYAKSGVDGSEFIQMFVLQKPMKSWKSDVYVNIERVFYYMFLNRTKFSKTTQINKQSMEILKQSIEKIGGIWMELDIPETKITEDLFLRLFHEHMPEVFL